MASSSTGAIEPDLADRELGGVHADRKAARAGVEIVAGEGALAALVELAAASSASGCAGITAPRRSVSSTGEGQSCQRSAIPVSPSSRTVMPNSAGGSTRGIQRITSPGRVQHQRRRCAAGGRSGLPCAEAAAEDLQTGSSCSTNEKMT